jgi:predicted ATPase
MLSSVLNSDRAIEVNIAIMRAFVQLRKISSSQTQLVQKLQEIEARLGDHDESIEAIFEAIQQLITPPVHPRKRIGFEVKESKARYGKRTRKKRR